MTTLQRTRFEAKPTALAAGLSLPRRNKRAERIHQRIGRLHQAYPSVARNYLIDVDVDADIVTAIRYQYTPTPNSKAELPGHYVIRSNATDLDGETLWWTYVQLAELEVVFRSLKSELGLRPNYHQLDYRWRAHLWISVLAYQCVQFLRRKLKAQGIDASWNTIRNALSQQQRITARFNAAAGGALHVRKTTAMNAEAAAIHRALGLDDKPGGSANACSSTSATCEPRRVVSYAKGRACMSLIVKTLLNSVKKMGWQRRRHMLTPLVRTGNFRSRWPD